MGLSLLGLGRRMGLSRMGMGLELPLLGLGHRMGLEHRMGMGLSRMGMGLPRMGMGLPRMGMGLSRMGMGLSLLQICRLHLRTPRVLRKVQQYQCPWGTVGHGRQQYGSHQQWAFKHDYVPKQIQQCAKHTHP